MADVPPTIDDEAAIALRAGTLASDDGDVLLSTVPTAKAADIEAIRTDLMSFEPDSEYMHPHPRTLWFTLRVGLSEWTSRCFAAVAIVMVASGLPLAILEIYDAVRVGAYDTVLYACIFNLGFSQALLSILRDHWSHARLRDRAYAESLAAQRERGGGGAAATHSRGDPFVGVALGAVLVTVCALFVVFISHTLQLASAVFFLASASFFGGIYLPVTCARQCLTRARCEDAAQLVRRFRDDLARGRVTSREAFAARHADVRKYLQRGVIRAIRPASWLSRLVVPVIACTCQTWLGLTLCRRGESADGLFLLIGGVGGLASTLLYVVALLVGVTRINSEQAKLEQWAAAAIADEALEPLGGFVAVNMFVKSNPLFFEIAGIAVTDNQVFFGAAGSMAWWSVMVSLLMNIISP